MDRTHTEVDGQNETWVPLDYVRAGQITDDELYRLLVVELARATLPVTCAIVSDSCHSGTMLDLKYSYQIDRDGAVSSLEPPAERPSLASNVLLISGCRDQQTSSDVRANGTAYGALTHSWLEALARLPRPITWRQLLREVNAGLRNYTQVAQLSSELPLDLDAVVPW